MRINRRDFLKFASIGAGSALSGCTLLKYSRIDPMHVLIRSDVITSMEQEREIISRARKGWTTDGRIRVLYLKGSPYERGYQHGVLMRKEINDNFGFMYRQAVRKFRMPELFYEAYERIRPFIPQEYIDEMHGLAHGAKMPLHVIQHIHALPSITEWGGKGRIKEVVTSMMNGELATSCSNVVCSGGASADGRMYVLRVLDWGLHRISKLHEYALIAVVAPDQGIPFVNIGWVGFIGAVSGMNAEGITLGEMGYGNPPNETMRGKPMPFLLREVLSQARNLKDVRHLISQSPGDCSFVYVMTDGKSGEAELYIRDRERFLVFKPGEKIVDRNNDLTPISDMVYGGHYNDKLHEILTAKRGEITPEVIMKEIVPYVAMNSNFQNVIYDPAGKKFWVSNARSRTERAAEQPYTMFDFGLALREMGGA